MGRRQSLLPLLLVSLFLSSFLSLPVCLAVDEASDDGVALTEAVGETEPKEVEGEESDKGKKDFVMPSEETLKAAAKLFTTSWEDKPADWSGTDIQAFVGSDIVELTSETFFDYIGSGITVLVLYYVPWCEHTLEFVHHMTGAAALFKPVENFVLARVNCDLDEKNRALCDRYEIPYFPYFLIFDDQIPPKHEPYRSAKELNKIVDYLNVRLKTRIEVPEPPSNVTKLYVDDFDGVVLDRDFHVILLVYSTMCAHSEEFMPHYGKLADIYYPDRNVVKFVKIDAERTALLLDRYNVSGFPSLYYFPPTNKNGYELFGTRNVSDLVHFINKHTGLRRTVEGHLNEDAGVFSPLSSLAVRLAQLVGSHPSSSSIEKEKNEIIEQLEKVTEALMNERESPFFPLFVLSSSQYLYLAREVGERGRKAVETTLAVLEREVEEGKANLPLADLDELIVKRNVAKSFLPLVTPKEEEKREEDLENIVKVWAKETPPYVPKKLKDEL